MKKLVLIALVATLLTGCDDDDKGTFDPTGPDTENDTSTPLIPLEPSIPVDPDTSIPSIPLEPSIPVLPTPPVNPANVKGAGEVVVNADGSMSVTTNEEGKAVFLFPDAIELQTKTEYTLDQFKLHWDIESLDVPENGHYINVYLYGPDKSKVRLDLMPDGTVVRGEPYEHFQTYEEALAVYGSYTIRKDWLELPVMFKNFIYRSFDSKDYYPNLKFTVNKFELELIK